MRSATYRPYFTPACSAGSAVGMSASDCFSSAANTRFCCGNSFVSARAAADATAASGSALNGAPRMTKNGSCVCSTPLSASYTDACTIAMFRAARTGPGVRAVEAERVERDLVPFQHDVAAECADVAHERAGFERFDWAGVRRLECA